MVWRKMFTTTASKFERREFSGCDRPVRIAVLDTGLDKDHSDIEQELERIWLYDRAEDRFKRSSSCNISDLAGHGTHITGLVLEYAPDAHVYVADVTVEGKANRDLIAKVSYASRDRFIYTRLRFQAMRCAVDCGVDVISISFGFQLKIPGDELEKAVDYAKEKKVHIFGAASNNGGNTGRAFPARYDNVFCIHSTDAEGNPSSFNPTEDLDEVNFATVGEAVESSWPKHLLRISGDIESHADLHDKDEDATDGANIAEENVSVKVKSGTSFATPIAACIATFLLRYSRTHLDSKYADQLKRHSVMKSVMKCIAGRKRKGFYYLTLRDNPDHLFGQDSVDIQRAIETVINQSG
jgi:subtilisin family serine protease